MDFVDVSLQLRKPRGVFSLQSAGPQKVKLTWDIIDLIVALHPSSTYVGMYLQS